MSKKRKRVNSLWNPEIDRDISGEPDAHTMTRKEYFAREAEYDERNKTGQIIGFHQPVAAQSMRMRRDAG